MPPKLELNLLCVICGNEIYILTDEEMEGHDLHTGILYFLFRIVCMVHKKCHFHRYAFLFVEVNFLKVTQTCCTVTFDFPYHIHNKSCYI